MSKRIREICALAGVLGLFAFCGLTASHEAASTAVVALQGGLTTPALDGDSGQIDWP
ncbi:hypothetical protein [Streptomyces sp. NPDC058869]|uniref:hypothetical protein n=1 Tax=Streptomyces sp. NPDC058869 TaxID=3346659 RepID=UPI0036A86F77